MTASATWAAVSRSNSQSPGSLTWWARLRGQRRLPAPSDPNRLVVCAEHEAQIQPPFATDGSLEAVRMQPTILLRLT